MRFFGLFQCKIKRSHQLDLQNQCSDFICRTRGPIFYGIREQSGAKKQRVPLTEHANPLENWTEIGQMGITGQHGTLERLRRSTDFATQTDEMR